MGKKQTSTDKLVFILETGKGAQKQSQLIVSDLDGRNARILYTVKGLIFSLSASYNGQKLVFTQQSGKSYPLIYVFDIATKRAEVISPTTANNFGASLSPDGRRVLYASSVNDNPEIYLSNLNHDTPPLQLTFDANADIAPVWMPDAQSFLFTSDRQGEDRPQIYRYRFDSRQVEQVTTTGRYNAIARVSPNGQVISFTSSKGQARLMDLQSGEQVAIDNQGAGEPINFSPDGHTLVYTFNQQIHLQPLEYAVNDQNLPRLLLGKPITVDVSAVLSDLQQRYKGYQFTHTAVGVHEPILIRGQNP